MIRHNGITIDRKHCVIAHGGQKKRFFPNQCRGGRAAVGFKIWEALILGHFNHHQIFELAYGDCIHGGPIVGAKVIDIRICQWIPEFERLRLYLDRQKNGGFRFYQLVPF